MIALIGEMVNQALDSASQLPSSLTLSYSPHDDAVKPFSLLGKSQVSHNEAISMLTRITATAATKVAIALISQNHGSQPPSRGGKRFIHLLRQERAAFIGRFRGMRGFHLSWYETWFEWTLAIRFSVLAHLQIAEHILQLKQRAAPQWSACVDLRSECAQVMQKLLACKSPAF